MHWRLAYAMRLENSEESAGNRGSDDFRVNVDHTRLALEAMFCKRGKDASRIVQYK
jgi:hypothetical protein